MDKNSDMVWIAVASVAFLLAVFLLQGGNSAPKETKKEKTSPVAKKDKVAQPAAKSKGKKDSSAKQAAKAPVAEKPAAEKKAAPEKKAPPAPAPAPKVAAPAAPETFPMESDMKVKKPKETSEQKAARLKRQEAAKSAKKASESSARAPAAAPVVAPVIKPKPPAEDEWEIVTTKRKPPKKKEEVPEPAAANPAVVLPAKVTNSVSIDSKRVGGIIGPKGVTLRQIQDTTETDIQIPRSDPERPVPSVNIAVTGPAAGVDKAITILTEIATTGTSPTLLGFDPNPAAPVATPKTDAVEPPAPPVPKVDVSTLAVKVESRKMGAIIGPKGATLHAIQDATETEINTTTAPNAEVTSVVVTGPAAGVAKAGKAINELATKGYCLLLSGEGFQESHIHVPPRFLAEIIGRSGSTIRSIQENTGARVVIPPSAPRPGDSRSADNEAPVKVILAGPKEGIAQAKQIITQITELYYHPVTHPGVVHVNLDVPEKYFNFIIGTKGSEIKHIQNNFKVSVKIPDRNTVFQSVLVIGEIQNCDNAVRYINKLITQVDAREQERAEDQWGGKDDEECYDEELMNRYVYSRQNKNRDEETSPVPEPVPEATPVRTRPISERPPGFSPMGKEESAADRQTDHGAVPLNWGPVKSTMTW